MKIVDAHNHPDWCGHDLTKFLHNMDENGISQCWLMPWECAPTDYSSYYQSKIPAEVLGSTTGPIPFTRCLSYVERCPERFILGCCPDPRRPGACDMLVAAHDIYGARVCGELKVRTMFDDPDVIRLCRTAGELGMPVTVHLDYDCQKTRREPWSEWFGGTIDALERLLQACPETRILGHAPGFWIHISGDDLWQTAKYPAADAPVIPGGRVIELLRKYPNLYGDMSSGSGRLALSRDPEHARRFITEFQDRLLFARDYFDDGLQVFLDSLSLPEPIREKIYFRNAEKLIAQ